MSEATLDLVIRLQQENQELLGQIGDQIGDIGEAADNAGGKTSGFFGGMLQMAGGILGAGLFEGLIGGFGDIFSGAQEAVAGQNQLNQMLGVSGTKAGQTADSINAMAEELQALSGVEDDVFIQTSNMMLQFENIQGDMFPRAQQAALDWATALNNGVVPSAEQAASQAETLARMLDRPAEASAKLAKAGVVLSDEQQKTIESMVAMGDIAGAQGIILAELEGKYQGAAETAGGTFGGEMSKLKNEIGGFLEGVVVGLLPALTELVGILRDNLGPALTWIGEAFTQVGGFVTQITSAFSEGGLSGALEAAGGIFAQLGEKAVAWISEALPVLQAKLGEFFQMAITFVQENVPGWIAALGQLAEKAAAWVLDALPGLGANLGTLMGQLLAWVTQAAVDIAPKLLELAGKFLAWVATDVIPALPGVLATIAESLWGFVRSLAEAAGPALRELAIKFYLWITETVIPELPGKLGEIWSAITGWVEMAALAIPPVLLDLAKKFYKWVETDVIPFLGEKLGLIWKDIEKWVGETAGKALAAAKDIGKNLMQGLKDGASAIWGEIKGWFTGRWEEIKATFDLSFLMGSPSRWFHERGGFLMQGLAGGIQDNLSMVDGAMASMHSIVQGRAAQIIGTVQGIYANAGPPAGWSWDPGAAVIGGGFTSGRGGGGESPVMGGGFGGGPTRGTMGEGGSGMRGGSKRDTLIDTVNIYQQPGEHDADFVDRVAMQIWRLETGQELQN